VVAASASGALVVLDRNFRSCGDSDRKCPARPDRLPTLPQSAQPWPQRVVSALQAVRFVALSDLSALLAPTGEAQVEGCQRTASS